MYEAYFNLSGKPFQLNPDPSFFYGSRGHRRALAYLEYGLHQNEGFIVVTGEVGAGKTTLLRSLLERLDSRQVVAATLVSTQVSENDILRMVAAAFGVPVKGLDKAGVLLALETYFVHLATTGKRALLIVDEAQNLSPATVEELRMLSNFQLEDHALLQSFLVGQPEFREIMQSPQMQQLRQRVIASYHLGPLDEAETRAYIEHRLKRVDWKNDPIIEPAVFPLVHKLAGGIPRRINTILDRLLLTTFLAEKHVVDIATVHAVMAELNAEMAPVVPSHAVAGGALPGGIRERLRVPGALADQATALAASTDIQRLEARLVTIESALNATLDILQTLLQAVRDDAPASSTTQPPAQP